MKITAPQDAATYFRQTEHAVKHAYAGLDSCWQHYKQALQHWDMSHVSEPMTADNKVALDRYLKEAGKYFDLKFSEAMFAGSVLQIAHMAIRLYSHNNTIPETCAELVPTSMKKVIPFCIGKERYGVPTGLIIYAGRNQYNHWDDEQPHEVQRKVFRALSTAFSDNPLFDLGLDLSNPTINVFANEVLLVALGFKSYETYLVEMTALFN